MSAHDSHRVYLISGLFGFGKLAGYDYFEHLERALTRRFADAGVELLLEVVSPYPTASIPLRATALTERLQAAAHERGPIHLIGHSTGGLDARLVVTPGARLAHVDPAPAWKPRVRSVVTINTPHYGTPLAGYFATTAGTRVLYLLSLLTVLSLSVGKLPLSAFSSALTAVSGLDKKLGIQLRLLDELTTQILRFVGPDGRKQIEDYLSHVKHDQGGVIQLMPEVMELFNAAVGDNPAVRYGCIATRAPAPSSRRVLATLGRPLRALHLAVYSTVYAFASRAAARYPYAKADEPQRSKLANAGASAIRVSTVDGIVPTLSMLWGELIYVGIADHLDIVGHFADRERPPRHADWLHSGANFTRREFEHMVDALAGFLLRS